MELSGRQTSGVSRHRSKIMEEQVSLPGGIKVANAVLAASGVVCLFTLIYHLYIYSWAGQRQFVNWMGPALYYVAPGLVAILLFAAIRLRSHSKVNFAVSLCSIVLTLYSFALAASIWFSLPSVTSRQNRQVLAMTAKTLGVQFDSRSKKEVVRDLRRRGLDAVLAVFPQVLLKKQSDGTVKSAINIEG